MIDNQIKYDHFAYLSDFVTSVTKLLPWIFRNRLEDNSNYNLSGKIALKTTLGHALANMYDFLCRSAINILFYNE